MQIIMDDICASVPFHVGDLTEPISPIVAAEIKFPHVVLPHIGSLPESISLHGRQVACSGAMAIYRVLSAVVALARDQGDDFYGTVCNGQLDWILGQISRLQGLLNPRPSFRQMDG